MGLDIDSFLDNVGKEEIPKPEEKEIKKVNLEFQKELEGRIDNVKKDSQGKDVGILKEIYDEVRNFNVDLPNKFLGIENKSGIALKDLGEKYSQEFLVISKNNAKIITNNIENKLIVINEFMQNEDYVNVLETYRQTITEFNYFPKAILNEKIVLSKKIRDIEIIIFTKLEEYKNKTIFNLKAQINDKIQRITELVRTSKLKDAEKEIGDLEEFSNHLPKLLLPDLIEEKIKITKVLMKSQDFLIHKYNEEFEYRNNLINQLFEKFHTFYIRKNISETIITYDEIIVEFKTLPDFFVEKKIEIFKRINELYTKLNKLILNRNIFMFVETYEYSKRIEGIREYLTHVERSNNFDQNNLIEIKRRVSELPKQFIYEKEEFNKKIKDLTMKIGKDKSHQEKYNTRKIEKEFNKNIFQEEKLNNSNKQNLNLKGAKKDILIEIDRLYKEFKLTSDSQKVQTIYKKITFYLNIANISPNVKKDTLKKLTRALHEKKLN